METRDTPIRSLDADGSQPSKPKRQRKSRSRGLRTRTGCLTCRSRHKKCDENLPVCGPCSIANRDCAYSEEANRSNPTAARSSRQYSQESIGPSLSSSSTTGAALPPLQERRDSNPYQAMMMPEPAGSSPHALPPPPPASSAAPRPGPPTPSLMTIAEVYHYAQSPDTVASEQLTADMASNRWLDLLATDAAQADANFSLAPSPAPFEEDSSSSASRPRHPEARPIGTENQPIAGVNEDGTASTPVPTPALVGTFERHAWSLDQDIKLTSEEAYLFSSLRRESQSMGEWISSILMLALRNVGLCKAILALCARHRATSLQAGGLAAAAAHSSLSESDPSGLAVQYYYETLHYLQIALQYESYTHSEELLATALVISTYEMLDSSKSNWKRHLKGVFWIQRSQNVNGVSGGLRQSVWWAWLRQDIWAAFRERRRCFSFWRPLVDYPDLSQDDLANRIVYLLSQTVNYCSKTDGTNSTTSSSGDSLAQRRAYLGEALLTELERWKMHLGPSFQALPTPSADSQSLFTPIWIHPPRFAVSMQIYNFIRILITLHRPVVSSGFDGYLKTQRVLHEAVNTICGIAMELRDEGSQIMSAQCLFGDCSHPMPGQLLSLSQNQVDNGANFLYAPPLLLTLLETLAGLCVQEEDKRKAILSLIDACESRTGWPMAALRDDLISEWARVT
ncbi:hypothetical protein PG987_006536 [Apiospora arundinis]